MSLQESIPALFDMDAVSEVRIEDDGPRVVPSIILNSDAPRVRKSDPLTSHQAADSSNRADSKDAVLHVMLKHRSLPAYQVEKKLPQWSPSRIRTALKELAGEGLVVRSERTVLTPYGRPANVWEVAS